MAKKTIRKAWIKLKLLTKAEVSTAVQTGASQIIFTRLLLMALKRKMPEDFIVNMYCPNILGITIDTIARVALVDKMITPSIESANFIANFCRARSIEISGTSDEAYVNISGTGTFNGYELSIQKAR